VGFVVYAASRLMLTVITRKMVERAYVHVVMEIDGEEKI
jgi:hypothetical protein